MSYYYTISKKGETSGNLYKVFLRKKAICNFSDCCIHRIHFHSMGEQSLISNPTPKIPDFNSKGDQGGFFLLSVRNKKNYLFWLL